MASTYSDLKFELIGTGEQSGVWGTTTNDNIGTAIEQALVGLGNPIFTTDANLTISLTNTVALQTARALVLNATSSGSLTATRELVVPTIEKQYIVQNNTTGGQSITVKTTAGTGITITNGRKAHLYVDGVNVIQMFDFVDINGGAVDGTPIGASSASTGAFTTLAASGAVTLSGGTANGVAYLNGSKVLTSGSALTFDGTNLLNAQNTASPTGLILGNSSASTSAGARLTFQYNGGTTGYVGNQFDGTDFNNQYSANRHHIWINNSAEQMRLTSTGLGIGTSSPGAKLEVSTGNAALDATSLVLNNTYNNYAAPYNGSTSIVAKGYSYQGFNQNTIGQIQFALDNAFDSGWASSIRLYTSNSRGTVTERMRLDSSGNLGLGVTPSAWHVNFRAYQAGSSGYAAFVGDQSNGRAEVLNNCYASGASTYTYSQSLGATRYSQQLGSHVFYTAPSGTAGNAITFTQALTLDASGNLLLGTTSAISDIRLRVSGGGINVAQPTSSASGSNTIADNGSSPNTIRFYNNTDSNNSTNRFIICDAGASVVRAEIRSNGGIANYQANDANLSDRREKTNFAPAKSYLDTICAIPVQTFNYADQNMEEDGGLTLGVVAQDVQAVAPELVMESNWGTKDEPKMRLSIYQTDLQYALMKALQELKAEFDAYKAAHP